MRRVAYKMPRIMPAQLPTAHPHQPQPNTCRQIGNKVGGWIRPLSYQKGNFDSSVRDKKKKIRRKQKERSVGKQRLPNQGTKRSTRFRRMIPAPRQWRRGGRGNADARSWLDLDRGGSVGLVVLAESRSRGEGGRWRALPSRAEPTGTGSFPVACGRWTQAKGGATTHTHARTNGGPRQTRRWDHVS